MPSSDAKALKDCCLQSLFGNKIQKHLQYQMVKAVLCLTVIVNFHEDCSWNVSRSVGPGNRSGKELWASTEAAAGLVRLNLSLKADILINYNIFH